MASNFTSYGAFKTGVAAWLDIPDAALTSTIDDLITVGEQRIFREARTRDMEQTFSTSIGSGVIPLWSDYVEMKMAYVNTSPVQRLERRQAEWIYNAYPIRSSTGVPAFFARDGSNLIFGPYPDSSYTVNGTYYKRLSSINPSLNTLFTNNPDLYLFACLAEAEVIIGRDPRIPIWEAKYLRILADVNGEDRREDQSGSNLQMRVA